MATKGRTSTKGRATTRSSSRTAGKSRTPRIARGEQVITGANDPDLGRGGRNRVARAEDCVLVRALVEHNDANGQTRRKGERYMTPKTRADDLVANGRAELARKAR